MKQSLNLIKEPFGSSSNKTPQYLTFHRTFKREFTKHLLGIGCKDIQFHKPNHFDVSGFFTGPNNRTFYFSIGDLRWNKERIMIRTASHYKDYSGGSNYYYNIDETLGAKVANHVDEHDIE